MCAARLIGRRVLCFQTPPDRRQITTLTAPSTAKILLDKRQHALKETPHGPGDRIPTCTSRYQRRARGRGVRARATIAAPEDELFYKLGREYWGQGYAGEACRALIEYAFGGLRLRRIVTVTHKDNSKSMALLRRLGMNIVAAPRAWRDDVLGVLENHRFG